MGAWLVVAGPERARALEAFLRASDASACVRIEADPWRARELLRGPCAGWGVVVGEGTPGPDAVNLAAGLAAEGQASDVTLVVAHASGSLRSRAKKAGISRVLTADEMAVWSQRGPGAKGASSGDAKGRAAEGRPAAGGAPVGGRGPVGASPACYRQASGGSRAGNGAPMRADRLQPPPATSVQERWRMSQAGGGAASGGGVAPGGAVSGGSVASSGGGVASGVAIPPGGTVPSGGKVPPAPPRREGVPVVCFVSGRGGVGKSTACALAGHIAAGWGMSVALLDLDLAFGNLAALCGVDRVPDLARVAQDEGSTSEAIDACGRQLPSGMGIWGPCVTPEHAELVYPHVERIVCRLTQTHDMVLVDTTTNWCDAVACAAQMADRLVIVSDDRPGAVPALVRCGALAVRLGVARTRIVRLMNGCDPRGRDMDFVTRAAQGLECARELRVLDGGDEAMELLAGGHAADLAQVDNPLAASLATGLAQLLRELGSLPECEAATKALEGGAKSRRFFGKRREVA